MRIAIHQPDYLPWCGFFYKMARVDLFVILDDCGFSQRRATHRVQIRRGDETRWLTVPVGKTAVPIIELVPDARQNWSRKHWQILHGAYSATPYWHEVTAWLKPLLERGGTSLADFNMDCLRELARVLDIPTPLARTSELPPEVKSGLGTSGTRVVNLCRYFQAQTYFSGHGARAYNDEAEFAAAGVRLEYSDFVHPVYRQTGPDFIPGLSVIDFLANCGTDYAAAFFARARTNSANLSLPSGK